MIFSTLIWTSTAHNFLQLLQIFYRLFSQNIHSVQRLYCLLLMGHVFIQYTYNTVATHRKWSQKTVRLKQTERRRVSTEVPSSSRTETHTALRRHTLKHTKITLTTATHSGNSLVKLRHTRSVAYSVELVLLNKQQISGGRAHLDYYPDAHYTTGVANSTSKFN